MTIPLRAGMQFAKRARYIVLFSVIATACGGGGANTGDSSGNTDGPSTALPGGQVVSFTGDTGWQSGASSRAQAAEPFTFVAYGDSRAGTDCGDNAVHMRLVQRMTAEQPTFVFHLGDMIAGNRPTTNWVQNGDCTASDRVGSFKSIIAPLQTRAPPAGYPTTYFPVVGNHDDNWGARTESGIGFWYPDSFNHGFCDVFAANALAQNHTAQPWYSKIQSLQYSDTEFYRQMCSKDRNERDVYPRFMYYSFNYRNSHFVVLRINNDDYNLEECGGGYKCDGDKANYDKYYNIHQLDWLRNDLALASADSTIKNIFVFLHTPLFSNANHPGNASRRVLIPEFSKHKVKLVFSGHNHVYERTVPIYAIAGADGAEPTLTPNHPDGTTYIVTGGGGSPLDTNFPPRGEQYIAKEVLDYHYVKVDVSGDKVSVRVTGQTGQPLDSYSSK